MPVPSKADPSFLHKPMIPRPTNIGSALDVSAREYSVGTMWMSGRESSSSTVRKELSREGQMLPVRETLLGSVSWSNSDSGQGG